MVLDSAWEKNESSPSSQKPKGDNPHARRRQQQIELEEYINRQIEQRRLRDNASKENQKPSDLMMTSPSATTVGSKDQVPTGAIGIKAEVGSKDEVPTDDNYIEAKLKALKMNAEAVATNANVSVKQAVKEVVTDLKEHSMKSDEHTSMKPKPKPNSNSNGTTEAPAASKASTQNSLNDSKHATSGQGSRPKIPQTMGLFVKGDPSLKDVARTSYTRMRSISRERTKSGYFGKPNAPKRGNSPLPAPQTPQAQKTQKAASPSLNPPRRTAPRAAPPPPPGSLPLKGDALIAEQNRRALAMYGGSAKAAPGLDPGRGPGVARAAGPQPPTAPRAERERAPPVGGEAIIREQVRRARDRHDAENARRASNASRQEDIAIPIRPLPTNIAPNDRRFDNLSGPSPIRPEHIKLQRPEEPAMPLRTMADYAAWYTHGTVNTNEDQRHVTYFDRWATPEKRTGGPAQIRRVILSNLPIECSARDVVSLVWAGDLEEIKHKTGEKTASVLFMNARQCARYLEETANGIEYKGRSVWVEAHKEVEPLVGTRKEMINHGVTRVVRAQHVPDKLLPGMLNKLGKDTGAMEYMGFVIRDSGKDTTWRFCNLEASSSFKATLVSLRLDV
ncbi:MAG: hypothetical protein Q9159_002545 [Coniocarpon cinnabarinum]